MNAFEQILKRLQGIEYEIRSRDYSNEAATIVAVNDPKNMGRVKVQYGDDIVSDWIGVIGSNRGQLSSQFIGARCIVSKLDGASNRELVIGITSNDPESAIISDPVQIPILSEQANAFNRLFPEETGDRGVKCNEGNAGRVYIFSNEMHMTPSICLRVNNFQETESNTPLWNWVPLRTPRVVEKGFSPGDENNPVYVPLSEKGPGIPECNQAMDGQRYVFSEDRTFRTYEIICLRDENKRYTWKPVGAPPTIFRTNLPPCTEKMHGVQFLIDDGDNSELATCQRFQGSMQWIKNKRDVLQFHQAPFLDKISFLTNFAPVPSIVAGAGLGLLGGVGAGSLIQSALGTIPAFSPISDLGSFLSSPGFLNSTFNLAQNVASGDADIFREIGTLANNFGGLGQLGNLAESGDFSNIADFTDSSRAFGIKGNEILNSVLNESGQTGIQIPDFISQAQASFNSSGPLPEGLNSAFNAWGNEGSTVFKNIVTSQPASDVPRLLGQTAFQSAFNNLDPQDRGIYTGGITGGMIGALDAASIAGRPLPAEFVSTLSDVSSYLGNYNGSSSIPSSLSAFVSSSTSGFRER